MEDLDILGTFEFVQGSAVGEFEGLEFDYEGMTEMFWDTAETVTDEEGNMVVLDRNGDTYLAVGSNHIRPEVDGEPVDEVHFVPVRVEYEYKVVRLK